MRSSSVAPSLPGTDAPVADDGSTPREPGRPLLLPAVVALAVIAVLVCLVALLYAASLHAVPGNSDGATVVLEGRSFITGHLTLKGWSLSLDSFWLVDVLFYALFSGILGLRADLLNLVPAVIGALVVLVGARLASAERRTLPAALGALTVFALIGLPAFFFSTDFLQGPLHIGTALWCLIAFLLLRRGTRDWRLVLAVVLLGAAMLSDLQALFFGIVPVALGGLAVMVRRRHWRPGILPVAAAAASVVFALVLRQIADLIGTFYVNSPQQAVSHGQMADNVGLVVSYGAKLLGVGQIGLVNPGVPHHLEQVHWVAIVAIGLALCVAVARLLIAVVGGEQAPGAVPRRELPEGAEPLQPLGTTFLDDVLLFATFAAAAIFVDLTQSTAYAYARYLTAAVIFAAILTGRMAADLFERLPAGWWRRGLAGFAMAVLACFAAGFGYGLAQPDSYQPAADLAGFLEQHHLTAGLGDYWSASITTVESNGAVAVRPVITDLQGRLLAYPRNSEPSWYVGKKFQFFVYQTGDEFGGANGNAAELTFGKASHTYYPYGFVVLVWNQPKELPKVDQ